MAKAGGVGGVFLRSKDPKALYAWYAEHLGLSASPDDTFVFDGVQSPGITVVAFFPMETEYFGPGGQRVMLNFRVDDLEGVLRSLGSAGVSVDARREQYDYGRFGWFTDPEGNRVELWQPQDAQVTDKPLIS